MSRSAMPSDWPASSPLGSKPTDSEFAFFAGLSIGSQPDPRSARKKGSDSHLLILRGGVALVSEENQRHGAQFSFVFLDPGRIDRR
jgi:hypothetical protein